MSWEGTPWMADQCGPFVRSVLDTFSSRVVILDGAGRVLLGNRSWREFIINNGASPGACDAGRSYLEICEVATGADAATGRSVAEGVRRALAGACEEFAIEYSSGRATARRWFLLRVRRLEGAGSGRVIVIHEDIAAAGEDKACVRVSDMAHLSRIAAVGAMASSLAHELNQPLTAICGYAEACQNLLRQGVDLPGNMLEYLSELQSEAVRAGRIVQRFRAYVRKAPPQRGPQDINAVVREALDIVRVRLQRSGVGLRLQLADGLEQAAVDPVQIQQVLVNLVQNAMDAMAAVEPANRRLVIKTAAAEGGIRVSISDSGVGLSSPSADRLFQPFFTTKVGGLGLGLSICRSIIESHGGRISASANADHGMTFEFTVPTNGSTECRTDTSRDNAPPASL